jgi:Protein of unknown function (DUF2948)
VLHLAAQDKDDLPALSAQMQDAVIRVADIHWAPSQKRFLLVANRYAWDAPGEKQRRRSGLRFNFVSNVRRTGPKGLVKNGVLSLLAITFEASGKDPLSGFITLQCSGGQSVRLDVECVDVQLDDLGPAWGTSQEPQHG